MRKNIILLILLVPQIILAQGFFGPQQIISSTSDGATFVTTADIDGDGDMDIISASGNDRTIAWFENLDGNGTFGTKDTIAVTATSPMQIFVTDIDGDGDMDVISVPQGLGNIAWYENTDGNGTFGSQKVVDITTGGTALCVFSADFDNDNDNDILVGFYADTLAWYENTDGIGTFGPKKVISSTVTGGCYGNYSSDIDGDGDMDALSASHLGDEIAWYENDGNGNFGSKQSITTTADDARSVFSIDMDGDGDMDVLSASYNDDKIAWYENIDGLGTFGTQQIISTLVDGATSVWATDIENDGDIDVFASAYTGDELSWYENDGNENFGVKNIISTAVDGPTSICLANINNDGIPDVVSSSVYDDKIAWYKNITIVILTDPISQTVCAGNNTTFNISAINVDTYQWQENAGSGFLNLSNGGIYSGINTNTLSITGATSGMDSYLYRCVCTNTTSTLSSTSNSATLTVNSISANAGFDSQICEGNTYTVSTASATDYTSLNWSTSGTGTFTNGTTLTPTYSPSANDISVGTVVLTLTQLGYNQYYDPT